MPLKDGESYEDEITMGPQHRCDHHVEMSKSINHDLPDVDFSEIMIPDSYIAQSFYHEFPEARITVCVIILVNSEVAVSSYRAPSDKDQDFLDHEVMALQAARRSAFLHCRY